MDNTLKKLLEQIDSLALRSVMLEPGDIPGLGEALKNLEAMEQLSVEAQDHRLISVVGAMKEYLEKVILGEKLDLSPFEKGISQLQEITRNILAGTGSDKQIASLLSSLGCEKPTPHPAPTKAQTNEKKQVEKSPQEPNATEGGSKGNKKDREEEPRAPLGQEDREIIADFVTESLENLGTIEVKVMDLEQDPTDLETINAIFRPFHTIKGVSGFLNFTKINHLAHISENLLDRARNGSLHMDAEMVDLVLESADTLKKMIESVHASLETESPKEGPTDIGPLIARIEHCIKQAEALDKKPLGQILLSKGAVSEKDVKSALETQKQEKGKKIGEILVEENKVAPKEVVSALREQKRFSGPVALSVKIDTRKLDSVVDMVGELAIAQSILRQNEVIRTSRDRNLDRISSHLSQITSELQRTAMALRMEPIKNTFQKMLRLVRDLAKKAGKEVQLVMSGEDTEIDRNMVEEIYEPMVHMIRNSVDHGLETPQEREKAGKPRRGSIFLRAYHKGGDIVIEIEDDGKGLDREKILEKAVANGLVKQGQKLTDAEINNLIFHPGFSTAEKITDISGRGVGMDVVKSKIVETLKGRLDVHSTPGKGTTVTIRLPLTLAIMDGMVISVSRQRYIIPTLNIQESFKPRETDYHTLNDKGEMMLVRNKLVPLIRLDRLFNHNGNMSEDKPERPPWERLVVVVENQERKLCLLIDELLGKEEVVIKSLGGWLKNVKGIAGGAIMGDGRVGLILDIGGILNIAFGEQ